MGKQNALCEVYVAIKLRSSYFSVVLISPDVILVLTIVCPTTICANLRIFILKNVKEAYLPSEAYKQNIDTDKIE